MRRRFQVTLPDTASAAGHAAINRVLTQAETGDRIHSRRDDHEPPGKERSIDVRIRQAEGKGEDVWEDLVSEVGKIPGAVVYAHDCDHDTGQDPKPCEIDAIYSG